MNPTFISSWKEVASKVNATAHEKGWYDSRLAKLVEGYPELAAELRALDDAKRISLMHSELSEALEGLRHGNPPSDHIPEFSAVEEELADVVIRIQDIAAERGWRIPEAIEAKREFNASRPHKHGGKQF